MIVEIEGEPGDMGPPRKKSPVPTPKILPDNIYSKLNPRQSPQKIYLRYAHVCNATKRSKILAHTVLSYTVYVITYELIIRR